MRTTVDIERSLLDEAKLEAARTGRRVSDLVEEGLRLLLTREASTAALTELPTFGRSGLVAGVDLEDKDALMALLDEA